MRRPVIFFLSILILAFSGCSRDEEQLPVAEGKVIVLMYHRIVEGEAGNLYERSVGNLEKDLNYLKNHNIKILTFSDLTTLSESGKMPLGNSAIITFDDGDHSWYTLVKPLLLKYRMKATFFLWTSMMNHDSFITWDEVEDMGNYVLPGGERPFVFGSHTCSHQYLFDNKGGFSNDTEYNSYLDYELGESRKIIEEHTNRIVNVLSLPYGDGAGDPEIIAAAQRNGYKFVRTSIWGAISDPNANLFVIPSLPMLDNTEPDLIGYYLGIN